MATLKVLDSGCKTPVTFKSSNIYTSKRSNSADANSVRSSSSTIRSDSSIAREREKMSEYKLVRKTPVDRQQF